MTTPDHRTYLTDGDLRTAEDAAAFVLEHAEDMDTEWDASDVYNHLVRRLDRERRQACRRGALVAFATAARMMRTYEHDLSLGAVNDWLEGAITAALADALAFRAAARTP